LTGSGTAVMSSVQPTSPFSIPLEMSAKGVVFEIGCWRRPGQRRKWIYSSRFLFLIRSFSFFSTAVRYALCISMMPASRLRL
jgi:hypothetical protein